MTKIKFLLQSYLTPEEQRIIFFLLLACSLGIIIHFSGLHAGNGELDSLKVIIEQPTPVVFKLNQVTFQELQTIPGIGAVRAQAIIDYREANKPIEIDDLINVHGIGEVTLARIRIYFEGETQTTINESIELQQREKKEGLNDLNIATTAMNINDASLEDLMKVKGVGKVRGESIISYLEERGRIKNIDQLLDVKGIGPKTLEKIKELFHADND
jgi:competence protein ComEA